MADFNPTQMRVGQMCSSTLTVPRIADRVVQTAAMLVLDPIFEADMQPEQYAYLRDQATAANVGC